jgi:hypothetical protein
MRKRGQVTINQSINRQQQKNKSINITQSSTLGPLLFLMYLNNYKNASSILDYKSFRADKICRIYKVIHE